MGNEEFLLMGLLKEWVNKGISLHESRRCEEAINCYDKALKINQSNR